MEAREPKLTMMNKSEKKNFKMYEGEVAPTAVALEGVSFFYL